VTRGLREMILVNLIGRARVDAAGRRARGHPHLCERCDQALGHEREGGARRAVLELRRAGSILWVAEPIGVERRQSHTSRLQRNGGKGSAGAE
jgi:hypothetical protein